MPFAGRTGTRRWPGPSGPWGGFGIEALAEVVTATAAGDKAKVAHMASSRSPFSSSKATSSAPSSGNTSRTRERSASTRRPQPSCESTRPRRSSARVFSLRQDPGTATFSRGHITSAFCAGRRHLRHPRKLARNGISRRGRSQRPRRSVTAVPEAVGLVADFAGVRDGSIRKSAPTWLWSHAADLTAGQTRVRR